MKTKAQITLLGAAVLVVLGLSFLFAGGPEPAERPVGTEPSGSPREASMPPTLSTASEEADRRSIPPASGALPARSEASFDPTLDARRARG